MVKVESRLQLTATDAPQPVAQEFAAPRPVVSARFALQRGRCRREPCPRRCAAARSSLPPLRGSSDEDWHTLRRQCAAARGCRRSSASPTTPSPPPWPCLSADNAG